MNQQPLKCRNWALSYKSKYGTLTNNEYCEQVNRPVSSKVFPPSRNIMIRYQQSEELQKDNYNKEYNYPSIMTRQSSEKKLRNDDIFQITP